jgi:hypothetical protein
MNEVFQLQASNNLWFTANDDGTIVASEASRAQATYFEMMESAETIKLKAERTDYSFVHIRIRRSSRWLMTVLDTTDEPPLTVLKAAPGSWKAFFLGKAPGNSVFEVTSVPPIKGVNLGSWFIPGMY